MQDGKVSAAIRIARKQYMCLGGPYRICNRIIKPSDVYFAYTLVGPGRYTTNRYCIECAQILHGGLFKEAKARIASDKKKRIVSQKTGRQKFVAAKAKEFRKALTAQEKFLWDYLKSKKLGVSFYPQSLIHGYIVDFWCPARQLVIELDGSQHRTFREKDRVRDETLRTHGIRVLRFPSRLIFEDLAFILDRVKEDIAKKRS